MACSTFVEGPLMIHDIAQHFRELADNAPVMLWRAGPDKLCDFFNEPRLTFSGRTIEQERGNGWTQGVHPDDLDRCLRIYGEAFDRREEFSVEYRLLRHDGEYRWLLDRGRPFHRPDGVFAGYVGSCIDITDQKLAQDNLERAFMRSQELLHEKEALLAEVHHRVRNNVQVISSLLAIHQRNDTNPDTLRMLQKLRARVEAIAVVQHHIHEGDTLARVGLKNLFHAVAGSLKSGVLRVVGDEVAVTAEQASAMGMLATELLAANKANGSQAAHTSIEIAAGTDGTRIRIDGEQAPPALEDPISSKLIAAYIRQAGARIGVADGDRIELFLPNRA
jgi:PAS domain S-box-containing protein